MDEIPIPKINNELRIQIEQAAKTLALSSGQDQNLLTNGEGFQTKPTNEPIPVGWRLVMTFYAGFNL